MSSKTILLGLSIFRCGSERSVHGRPSWELAPYDRESEPKISPRGVEMPQPNAALMSALESVEWFVLRPSFFVLDKSISIPIRIGGQ